jgi:hypothetical protein
MKIKDLVEQLNCLDPDLIVVLPTILEPGSGDFKLLECVTESSYDENVCDIGLVEDGFIGDPCIVLWPEEE